MSLPCLSGWGSDAMSWSIEFLPFVPWPVLWTLAGLGAVLLALLFWRSRRGAIFRLLSYALLLLAIANPQLKQEDREPLNDVLAVVVDDSQSQAIAGRTARTAELRKELEERLKSFPNLDVRWVNSNSTSADSERDGTMLFTDLAQALADVPPDRLAGVIMITDGEVHDVPASAAGLGFEAPVHALLTGKPGESDRLLAVEQAPTFGMVGEAQSLTVRVDELPGGEAAAPVPVTVKIRLGWSEDDQNASEIAKVVEDSGASALCVHGRSREQRYSRAADWDAITDKIGVDKQKAVYQGWAAKSGAYPQ